MIVGAAVFVEGDQQGRVEVVRPGLRGGGTDGVVEPSEQVFAADQRGRRVPGQARGEHPVSGVHVVVGVADDLGLDEGVSR